VQPLDLPPPPAKPWALDGSMSGSGQARQIWTWALGKPNTPGPGPNASWELIAAKYATIESTEARHETYRTGDAEILIVSFGTTSVVVESVVDELRVEGIRVGSFRPITLWPFPGAALEAVSRQCAQVLVYELNAGQLVDDVRMHAFDRSGVRSIGGVSQDTSGMRQGELLRADVLRSRTLEAIGHPQGGPK
jgi:2-oxoglutarate/2-oxoacid ferredoxin oxidoreductase subunit alpha